MANTTGARTDTTATTTATRARADTATTAGGYSRVEFTAWLTESCRRQGVPVVIADAQVISRVAVLLKADTRGGPRSSNTPTTLHHGCSPRPDC